MNTTDDNEPRSELQDDLAMKKTGAPKATLSTEQQAIIHDIDTNLFLSDEKQKAKAKLAAASPGVRVGPGAHFSPPAAATKKSVLDYIEDPSSHDDDDNNHNHNTAPPPPPASRARGPARTTSNPGAYRHGGPEVQVEDPSHRSATEAGNAIEEGLAVANPVAPPQELPQATNFDSANLPARRERKNKAFQWIALLAIVGLAGIIVLVVALAASGRSSQGEDTTSTAEPTATITASPTLAPTGMEGYLLSLLPSATAEGIRQQVPDSAQGQAFRWLLEDIGTSNPNLPEARILQRFALATLYYATIGEGWAESQHWMDHGIHECYWFNKESFARKDLIGSLFQGYMEEFFPPEEPAPLHCTVDGLYENLWLDANNLAGYIPNQIAMLTSLKTLSIGFNAGLNGPIPTQIGRLSRLEGLFTYFLLNAQEVPSQIGLLTGLRGMYLSSASHRGTIPSEIWGLTKLQTLNSRPAQLSGTVPTQIGLMTDLRWLDFPNLVSGTMPTQIGKLTKMHWLEIRETKLSGTIPSQLGLLTKLVFLFVKMNDLTGTVHTELGQLRNLTSLAYMECMFSGTIPSELGQLTQIQQSINLENNRLTGAVPSELAQVSNLYDLALSENRLSGALPSELGLLTSLGLLKLRNNRFDSTVPLELSWLNRSLYGLSLEGNPFLSGAIPEGLCDINQTCVETSINLCEEHGLSFDCSNNLCGCGCPCGA